MSGAIHHLRQVEGFLSRRIAASGMLDELVGTHHATVEPMYRASTSYAADHADIGAINFRNHVADEKLRQTECVWNFGGHFLYSHCHSPVRATCAGNTTCAELTHVAMSKVAHSGYYGSFPVAVVPCHGTLTNDDRHPSLTTRREPPSPANYGRHSLSFGDRFSLQVKA